MALKTINIKGKEYAPVSERIKYFRENFQGWAIITELVEFTNEYVIIKASIIDPDGLVKSTGLAQEDRNASNINKTSFVENCESSAVGRALGIFGIGIDASIASADEVQNAIEQQTVASQPVSEVEINALKMACEKKGSKIEDVVSYYKKSAPEELTFGEFNDAMKLLARKK